MAARQTDRITAVIGSVSPFKTRFSGDGAKVNYARNRGLHCACGSSTAIATVWDWNTGAEKRTRPEHNPA